MVIDELRKRVTKSDIQVATETENLKSGGPAIIIATLTIQVATSVSNSTWLDETSREPMHRWAQADCCNKIMDAIYGDIGKAVRQIKMDILAVNVKYGLDLEPHPALDSLNQIMAIIQGSDNKIEKTGIISGTE